MHIDTIRQLAHWMAAAGLTGLQLRGEGFQLALTRPNAHIAAQGVSPGAAPKAPHVAAIATVCGHFHARHPSRELPQASPGQVLKAGDIVGLVAVAGLLLPVTAQHDGIAGDYLVEEGQQVEYATPVLALAVA